LLPLDFKYDLVCVAPVTVELAVVVVSTFSLSILVNLQIRNLRFCCVTFIRSSVAKERERVDFALSNIYIYRNTSHRVTWYITGLPNGTSLRAAQWTFA
jgi:hypothetical protein